VAATKGASNALSKSCASHAIAPIAAQVAPNRVVPCSAMGHTLRRGMLQLFAAK
jgi:hypothetical protein